MFLEEEELECTHSCSCCSGCGEHSHEEEVDLPEGFEPIITLTDDEGNEIPKVKNLSNFTTIA